MAAYAGWLLSRNDYYRDPNGLVDAAMLQKNIDTLYDMQFIKKPLALGAYLDSSYVDQAKQRLATP